MSRRKKEIVKTVVGTVLLTAVLLLSFAMLHHVLPRMRALKQKQEAPAPTPVAATPSPEPTEEPEATPEPEDLRTEWQKKFAEHFTDEVVITERSYSSPDLAIEISEHSGSFSAGNTTYYVADIYVGSVENFGACLAGDEFCLYYKEPIEQIAQEHNALLAINGDFYSYQLSDEYSVTVRNGVVYRTGSLSIADICVLFEDGTMETYGYGEYTTEELVERGVRHIWHFGPRLLLPDGSINQNYNVQVAITYPNPRTAVGYYEPGHYCFLVADGRQETSAGLRLNELAEIMKDMGCVSAYNLDGGGSTVMYFNGEKVNSQSNGGDRDCGDILYIAEKVG